MRIASRTVAGVRRFGIVDADHLDLLPDGTDVYAALAAGGRPAGTERVPWDPAAPSEVPVPVGTIRDFITFESHTEGSLRSVARAATVPDAWYEAPAFYFTNPHAAIGSGADVPVPPGCELLDFELEVAVVIGRAGHNLTVEQAWDHIAGYTLLNDWSRGISRLGRWRSASARPRGRTRRRRSDRSW